MLRMRQAKRWDLSKPQTLVGMQWVPRDSEKLEAMRRCVLDQLKTRLRVAREREKTRRGNPDGLQLEYLLRALARRCRSRDRALHFGVAGYVSTVFGPRARRALFGLLADIEESYETITIDWTRVWDAVEMPKAGKPPAKQRS